MRGLPSLIRLKLLENNPTPTLADMTAFVQRFRAVHRHDDASSFVQAMQTSTPVGPPAEDPLATSIAKLTAAVAALACRSCASIWRRSPTESTRVFQYSPWRRRRMGKLKKSGSAALF